MRSQVQELFHAVADLSAESRVQFFTEHDIDLNTQREVEQLLAFDSAFTLSLGRDILLAATGALARVDLHDTLCGPYRLKALLGRGGMGTVYSAERIDGEISQRVAVKLLRPGGDELGLRQRFLAERQILASLSHPNIAKLMDAGHREDGQPFLVMEYVEGQPIDVYAAGLSTRQKIALFRKVCAAVSHLHQNLVVHRDLKPPNILVSGQGEPKLLDFGIAKMLDSTADSTVTAMRILTPDYASPEQISGGVIGTATDIYALGAVLYKLLTGTSPHQIDGKTPEAMVLAASRGEIPHPRKIAPFLNRDLELILLKALRRDPLERYSTVEQLSDDLENYLESRPIRARKGDAWYRARKLAQRHWLPFTAVTVGAAVLFTALLVANRQAVVAQQRFELVHQLVNKLFDIDVEVRRSPGTTKARELLVATALDYLRRVSGDPRGDPGLSLEIGTAYMRVARVQGVPVAPNLGEMKEAEKNLEVAERFVRAVLASQPSNRTALLRWAQIGHDRMLLSRLAGHYEDALTWADQAAAGLESLHAGIADKSEAPAILNAYLNVADQYALGRRYDDALRLCRRGAELAQLFDHQTYAGTFHWVSAKVARSRGDLDQALQEIRESARILEPAAANADNGRTMNFILTIIFQGRILGEDNAISLNRSDEAVASFENAFRMADGFVHQDANDQDSRGRLAMAGLGLADILRHSAPRRALSVYDHTLRHLAEIPGNVSFRRFEVAVLAGSTYPLRRLGHTAEARDRLNRAFARLKEIGDYPAERVRPGSVQAVALKARADCEAGTGKLAEAIATYETLLGQIEAAKPDPDYSLSDALEMSRLYARLASLSRAAHRPGTASALEARQRNLWRRWEGRLPYDSVVARRLRATANPEPEPSL